MNGAVMVLLLLAWNPFRMEMPEVRRGNDAMRRGRYEEAERQYRAALGHRPGDPRIVYDLGLSLLAQGKYDEAVASFEDAARSPSEEVRYQALFHAGIAHFHRGDKALESYRPQKVAIQTSFNEFTSATDEKAKAQAAQKTLQLIGQARQVLKGAGSSFDKASAAFGSAVGVRTEEEAIANKELSAQRKEKVEDELDWLDELEEKLRKYLKDQKKKKQQNQKKNDKNQDDKKNQNKKNKDGSRDQNQQQQQNQKKDQQGQDNKDQNRQQKKQDQKKQGNKEKDKKDQNRQQSQKGKDRRKASGGEGKKAKGKRQDPMLRAIFRALDELKARQRRLMRERYLRMRPYRQRTIKDW